MKKTGPNLSQWRDYRLTSMNEAEISDINNPLIMKLEELKLHDIDNLIFKAQELITKSSDETVTSADRNIWKQKIAKLVQNLDILNSELNSLSELV